MSEQYPERVNIISMPEIHQGLINEGSTCYLNSLIQTLFMTYQFRQNVYGYAHDPKKIKQGDSIAYQLQKLFVQLQTKPKPAHTQGLLKSFQWTEADSFQQHDVQQFCRVLFEAVEKAHQNSSWIKDLFAGSTVSYICCGKHTSKKSQMFLDLSLSVRNPYTMAVHTSLEECILQYLRPQKLDDKFDCEECKQKVFVEKGFQFQTLPTIMTIQLNRFQLNYNTMQREKVNTFLYFPQILQMGKFMLPFHQIHINPVPVALQNHTVIHKKQPSARTINFQSPPPQADKPKRKNSQEKISNKAKTRFFDEENKDKRELEQKPLSKADEIAKNKQIMADLKATQLKIPLKTFQSQKPTAKYNIEQDMLFGGNLNMQGAWTSGSFSKQNPQSTEVSYEHEEESFDRTKEYPDGTYALYAVLVHAGGAYGGHYFAYIFDGLDWFKFDDSTVKKVSKFQMRKYGQQGASAFGANAYLLFYRDTKSFKDINNITISPDLLNKINSQIEVATVNTEHKQQRYNVIEMGLVLKIYKSRDEVVTVTIPNREQSTLREAKLMIKEAMQINEADENWRLRRYSKQEDTMHEVYGDMLEDISLGDIGFREQVHLAIETKTSTDIFLEYNPHCITIKLNVWQPGIILLTEKQLKPVKIDINDDAMFEELYIAVIKKTGIDRPLLIRRNFSSGNPLTRMDLEHHTGKRLNDLRFFNSINLYVQPIPEGKAEPKWAQEFESERFRCQFFYNHPRIPDKIPQYIYFDTRKTLGELKKKLSELIGIAEDDFRVKRSKQSLSEMTSYKKKLSELKCINNEHFYLEEGPSLKSSILLKRGEVSLIENRIEFTLFEQIQFELDSEMHTVGDLLAKIAQRYNIKPEEIRLREYKSFQFKEIFSRTDLLQRIREKSLIWEKTDGELRRGIQIYYRKFDMMSMELSPIGELYVDVSASYEEIGFIIEEETGIPLDRIMVWKPLSNYIEIDMLIDCEWEEVRSSQKTIREEPLFIHTDGEILIFKQADHPHNKLKPIQTANNSIDKSVKGKEAQLKITVVAENQIQQAQLHS